MPTEQRFAFDEVGELYDRHRPRYPEALFEDLISLSGISPDGRILEIGCGTGQATVPLARRGFPVLCLEPGPRLARLAREKLASFPNVRVICETFEAWGIEAGAFSLIVSAQAFHWRRLTFASPDPQQLCGRQGRSLSWATQLFSISPPYGRPWMPPIPATHLQLPDRR